MWRLRTELPKDLQDTLSKYEDDGRYNDDEYLRAMDRVYKLHLCRLNPWPLLSAPWSRTNAGDGRALSTSSCGDPTSLPGRDIGYWDVTTQLGEIDAPARDVRQV